MEKYKLGDTIRFLRKQMRLTQEQLAEGICSPITISRIESGVQFPSENILKMILNKLGQDLNGINLINFSKNSSLENLFDIAQNFLLKSNFDKTSYIIKEIYQQQNLDTLDKQRLNMLEIGLEMALEIKETETTSDVFIDRIYDALKLTNKNIDIFNIDKMPLSLQEINLLSFLAIIFSNNGKLDDAINIDKNLLKCFDFYKIKTLEQNATQILISIHLAQFYEVKEMYDESLDTLEKAINLSKNNVHNPFLCEICFFKGRVLYKKGNKKEGVKLLKDIYPYFKLVDNKNLVYYIEKFINQ